MWKWLFICVCALLAVVGLIALSVGRKGEGRIEEWVGEQLKSIVNSSKTFRLDFSTIDYQAPDRVELRQMRLMLADGSSDLGPLVEIEHGFIKLAELPRWGRPIVIKTVELEKPTVRIESFLAAAREGEKAKPRATTRPTLSSILTLREVRIEDGSISFDDGSGSPLSWTQLNARLDFDAAPDQWHALRLVIDQSPLMKTRVAAEIDLDAMVVRKLDVEAMLNLNDPAARQFFTPSLQRWLKKFEIEGRAELSLVGNIDGLHPELTHMDATADLRDGYASLGAFRLPIQRIVADANIRGRSVYFDRLEVEALGGSITGDAKIALDPPQAFQAHAVANRLRLNRLLKANADNAGTDLVGFVSADVQISSTLQDLKKVARGTTDGLAWGSGYVSITDGKLIRIPVIAQVMNASKHITRIFTGKDMNRDSFEAQFLLIDEIIDITAMLYRGDAIGMRGKGRIALNGEVDLVINAGPLERLQESLGSVGKVWGKITDSIMGYSVKGTLESPIVRPLLGSN